MFIDIIPPPPFVQYIHFKYLKLMIKKRNSYFIEDLTVEFHSFSCKYTQRYSNIPSMPKHHILSSMHRWPCPIHNHNLETFIWSIMWNALSFYRFKVSCSINAQITTVEKSQLKIINESGIFHIAIFAGGSLEITLTVPLNHDNN